MNKCVTSVQSGIKIASLGCDRVTVSAMVPMKIWHTISAQMSLRITKQDMSLAEYRFSQIKMSDGHTVDGTIS